MNPARPSTLGLAVVLSAAACSGVRLASGPPAERVLIPPGQPRLVLERVIRNPDSGGALRRLIGAEPGRTEVLLRPFGLAWLGDALLVTDPSAGRIVRVEPDGGLTVSRDERISSPQGIAVCPEGIVVSSPPDGRVAVLGPDLRVVRLLAEHLAHPTAVACSEDDVFVLETGRHRVVAYGPAAEVRHMGMRGSGVGEFNYPTSLALAGSVLLVGDSLNFRVQRFEVPSLGSLGAFGELGDAPGNMPRLKGLAIDAAGHVWASDGLLDRVSLYDVQGELLVSFGGTGADPGQFESPAGIAAHRTGRVAVADSLNSRIQVFRLLGGEAAT